ncbi:MAG TPA: copper resistance CopC family protein, partial [Bacillales bacterium]
MGKKVWILLLFLFGITVGTVSAHSVLVSSQPKDGAVVEDSLSELKLTFNTKIEKILSLKVIQKGEGQSFTPKASADGKIIKVTLSKPLENGSYDVDFRVIGEDGHAVEGGFSFKVKVNHSSDHQPKEKSTPDQKTQDQSQG